MAKTVSIRLTDHFERFVAEQRESGRYASLDEMVEAGLALLEENKRKLDDLRQAIAEGEASGFVEDFDFSDIYREIDSFDADRKTAIR